MTITGRLPVFARDWAKMRSRFGVRLAEMHPEKSVVKEITSNKQTTRDLSLRMDVRRPWVDRNMIEGGKAKGIFSINRWLPSSIDKTGYEAGSESVTNIYHRNIRGA
jgi:hypothetical protein